MRHPGAIDYRPDIDGLRAIAVLAVVCFHAFPAIAPGGFVGVDVFFVISGYLITSIILREHQAGQFTLWRFYARRIRRLFPALLLVLASTAAIGWFTLLPHEFRQLGRHLLAGAAYVSNFVLKQEAGYFDAGADEKPLLHLWSLAVEEQFYLVWPVLLLLVPRRWLFPALLAILIASFVSNIANIERRPSSSFYLPQNRFWELAIGSVLAFATVYAGQVRAALPRFMRDSSPAWQTHIASLGGLTLIAGSIAFLDRTVAFPGWWAAIPCLGAASLIAAGPNGIVNRMLLANPIAVGIGLISYPLYLWHWPLLSFASITGHEDIVTRLALVATATALSVATYLVFEKPFRSSKRPAVVAALFGASLGFCLFGLAAALRVIEPRHNAALHHDVGDAVSDWDFPSASMQRGRDLSGQLFYRTSNDAPETVMYFGDSVMEQYWPRVERLLAQRRPAKSVIFLTRGGCAPVPHLRHPNRHTCKGFIESAKATAADPKVKTIVLGALWTSYFGSPVFFVDGHGSIAPGNEAWRTAFGGLRSLLSEWRASGRSVWLVLNMPTGDSLAPASRYKRSFWGIEQAGSSSLDRSSFEKVWSPIRQELIEIARETGSGVIDPVEAMCSATICPGETREGRLIYKDARHLRASFVREHADFLDPTLLAGPPRP